MGMVESSLVFVNGSWLTLVLAFRFCILWSVFLLLLLFPLLSEIPWLICLKTGGLRRTLGWVGLAWLRCGLVYTPSSAGSSFPIFLSSSVLIPLLSRFWQAAHFAGWPHACVVLILPRFCLDHARLRHHSIIPPSSFVSRCHSFVSQYTMFNVLLFSLLIVFR